MRDRVGIAIYTGQQIATPIPHDSASNTFPLSSVFARSSIRNYDDIDSLVAQAQLVPSLLISP